MEFVFHECRGALKLVLKTANSLCSTWEMMEKIGVVQFSVLKKSNYNSIYAFQVFHSMQSEIFRGHAFFFFF